MNTPLYPITINRGQRSSEAYLNVVAECYIKGVYAREVSKIFNLFGLELISLTQLSIICKKLNEALEPWRFGDLDQNHHTVVNHSLKW